MKKLLLNIIMQLMFGSCMYSQFQRVETFQRVSVPDSIANKLEEAYNSNAKNVNAGSNIFNLLNRKCFVFKDGIYSFQGQGPHFPKRIFIYNNGSIFIFENAGAFNPKGVIQEFAMCIERIGLTDKQIVEYSKAISNYLEQEDGNTYGAEIKEY